MYHVVCTMHVWLFSAYCGKISGNVLWEQFSIAGVFVVLLRQIPLLTTTMEQAKTGARCSLTRDVVVAGGYFVSDVK